MKYCFLVLFLWTNNIIAQSISSQSIFTSTSNFSQNIGSIHFTVGDLVVFKEKDSTSNSIANGFLNNIASTTTLSSGTPPVNNNLKLKVYPNPFNTILVIDNISAQSDQTSIDIIDMQGRYVVRKINPSTNRRVIINTTTLNSGIYTLILKTAKGEVLALYKMIK